MTDKRISELTQITGADVDDANDELAIVDTSASETKAITRAELFSNVDSASISTLTGNLTGNVTGNLTGDVTGDVTGNLTGDVTGELDLAAIAETKGVTAVDVFVYDTSRDSDGGAWRKRTQHTSWYNETLNTSTRGSRREFPAVAVIVAEADTLTIYDGDDPSLPMWMVFNRAGGLSDSYVLSAGADVSCLSAFNGTLAAGQEDFSGRGGLREVQFVSDQVFLHYTNNTYQIYNGNISERNDAVGYSAGSLGVIVNRAVNDVAMTVLPDAPIDPATGLPVPTILCGTDGNGTYSTSIITDSGTVYDIASDSTGTAVSVAFDGVSAVVTRSDGTLYVWDDAGAIAADGASPDATYSASSTPALLGTVSEVAA